VSEGLLCAERRRASLRRGLKDRSGRWDAQNWPPGPGRCTDRPWIRSSCCSRSSSSNCLRQFLRLAITRPGKDLSTSVRLTCLASALLSTHPSLHSLPSARLSKRGGDLRFSTDHSALLRPADSTRKTGKMRRSRTPKRQQREKSGKRRQLATRQKFNCVRDAIDFTYEMRRALCCDCGGCRHLRSASELFSRGADQRAPRAFGRHKYRTDAGQLEDCGNTGHQPFDRRRLLID
jgi:hypothetical protein